MATNWQGLIAIIGAGQLGSSLLAGLLAAGHDPQQLRIATRRPAHAAELAEQHAVTATDAQTAVQGASLVVLATRPGQIVGVLEEIAPRLDPEAIVVSLAGDPDHATLAEQLPAGTPVLRVMPNPAMAVGAGLAGFCPAPDCPAEAAGRVRALFDQLGEVIDITEDQIGSIGSLAGHGQAVVYYVADALEQWGVMQGFNRAQARAIVAGAVAGAARMLTESDDSPAELQHRLCTPGGTTIRTVSDLDASGVRGAVIASVDGGQFARRPTQEEQ